MSGTAPFTSMPAALASRASRTPDRTAYVFLAEGEEEQERLTYAGLDARARAIAAALSRSVRTGERALLLYPPGLDFVAAFFGCLYAGVIAVPAYPPRSPRMMPRLLAILADAEPAVALAAGTSLQRVRGWLERTPEARALSWIATDELDPAPAHGSSPAPAGDAVAFLQYTSGSTSTPKGVMVTEANLVHNQRVIQEACGHSEESVFVSWLPVYHDLGLIGNLLQATWVGAPCVLMAPVAFLQNPSRWLRAISRYRGTTSGGPNFAYDLCARRAEGADLAGIDLSSWQIAFNGAEPVLPKTLESFAAAFAPHGFRAAATYPCYGLAEATLMVSGGSPAEPPRVESFRSAALERGLAEPAEPGEPGARPLAGCGRPLGDQAVVIVSPETAEPLPSGRIGEIWIAGPSVARGYWARLEETAEIFGARLAGSKGRAEGPAFLRTGDLGFLREGELYVTGRIKDLIILRGRNFYPQDIELTAGQSHPDLRPGGGAAFSVESGGEERLVLVHEVRRRPRAETAEIAAAIRAALAEEHEVAVSDVVLIHPETLPRTSSGKVRRRACREAYVAGELSVFGRSAAAADSGEERSEAAPRTPTEELLAGIWADLLGRERIGVHDDPFELGGHSLLAAQVVSRVHGALGVSLPLAALFEHPTVARLAKVVDRELRGGEAAPEAPPLSRVPRDHPLPLSFAQERLWFLDRLAPGSAAYNIHAGLRLAGSLALPALAAALTQVSRRHEALRTTFLQTPEGPVQRIGDRPGLELPAVDLTGLPEALREPELRRLAVAEAQRPFDLERGPLARAILARLGDREHVLLLTVHHIVSDGWSMGVLVREVAELYGALVNGLPSPLPELPVQYADFAVWQRRWLAEGALESQLAWWRGQLHGAPTVLDLPSDRPRPPVQSFRGRREPLLLEGELVLSLRSLGRREGATLYMVLLAAFQVLLARHSGQDDLLLGSPVAGRGRVEVEGLIGFFVNTLVLRGDLRSDPALRELLARTRAATLGAFDRQDVPFERLVEELEPQRDLSRNPLFQALLVLQNTPLPRLDLPGLEVSLLEVDNGTSRFDLSLSLTEQGGGLAGWMEHSADLFDGATVRRMLDRFATLLRGLASGAERRVSELPLLTAAEERQMLAEWSPSGEDLPRELCLHELFAAQAQRTPEAVAVRHAGESATYAELERRANQLAHHLRRLGVKPEGRVGVLLDRKPELAVTLLGTLKAGGAYVPLDPAYPRERLELMAEDAGLSALVTEIREAATLSSPGVRRVLLDEHGSAIGRESGSAPEPWARPGHLAYVIYTSGSTGRPKGVAIEHRSAGALMRWARAAFSDEELSGVLASTSVCFDLSVFELFAPLSWGGTVILADNALELPRLAEAADVTLLNTVPSAMAELAAGELPPRLSTVCLAGEPLRPGLAARVREHPQVRRLLNLYGPSEDTTYSTLSEVEPGAVRVTVGGPLPGTRAYLQDRHLRPVPVGVPGELFLAGTGLARGYLGRPELTAGRFLPDPWGTAPGARMYRTGDLARRLPSGEIDFLGRVDHQVKVRGFRIELGEIEAALAAHPSVAEAVVVAREDLPGGRDLVAYLVPAASGPAAGELREHLRSKLPAYMVPGRFVTLAALPRTATGKVDRRALPVPSEEPSGIGAALRTPVEELVAGAWAEVLGRGPVGREEDFFALGGHSLLATQVVSRLRDALGVDLPLRAFFASPTVAGVAAAVEDRRRGGALPAAPIEPAPRDRDLPLSFAQRRLWLLHQLEPESPAYNLPLAVRLAGDLDPALLAGALSAIVARHEPLRTTFRSGSGELVQVVAAPAPLPLPLVDLAALPGSAKELEILRLTAGEANRPFDLARGPVLRTTLLRLAAGEHRLLLTLHHIAGDGWSLDLFLRELARLYQDASAEQLQGLPPLPVRYADFAVWQRSELRGPVLAEQLSWWQGRLAGVPTALELPMEHPYPAVQTSRGAAAERLLAPELSHRIEELGRREGTTPFMTLLAALAVLLHRYTGQDDLVLGTPIAGRTRAETEGLIGLFLNTLALRIDLSGDPTVRELLGRVRETALGAFDHQDVPFESLLEELRLERDLSRTPLFQIMLNWIGFGAGSERIELPGLVLERLPTAEHFAKLDLEIYAGPRADGIFLQAVYRKDLFAPAQIDDLLAHLEALLAGVAAGPGLHLSELPLVAAWDERRGPRTAAAGPGFPREALDRSIPERFAVQAAAHAERPAVVSREGAWTYAKLAHEVDRVAHALLALRGFREDRVALLFSPGPAMVAAVMGALAAGKTYVPLDPSYPRERLLRMLTDSGAGAVLAGDDRRTLARELAAGLPIACFGELPPAPEGWAPPPVPPEALAYLLYTSGSTGQPKGVMQSQRNVLGHIRNYSLRLGLGPEDRVLLLASYSFDAAVMDLFGALLTGAALCIWDLKSHGPEGLGKWLAEQAVTVYHSTPTVYRAFLDGLSPGESFPALRLIVLGGEESRRQDLERLRETGAPGCRLVNGLGPTESTLALQRFLEPGEPVTRASLPVGWPVEETQVRLQSGAGEQPAVWGTGEIEICSPYLAVGYWHRPDLTAERFVPDPDGGPGARLYRTGDLARRLPDGELEFLGRADGQVKIRGFRIETGEVEAALAGHPGVREAAVVSREEGGERYLAAYVAPAPEGAPEPAELRAFLRERLPDYMVPAAFVLLKNLPLTPNGKLDRRALPAPERVAGETWVAPRGPVEEILAGIWAELLNVERAGAHDDFFALGGHSLLATRVVSRVRRSLGVELPLRTVFESPTVAGLASRVEEALRGGQTGRPPVERLPRPLPEGDSLLSFAQERLWFLDRLQPGSAAYNMPAALRLTGPLDLPALAASLAEIVRRHEVLRTIFTEVSGSPVPEVALPGPLPLPLVDLGGLPTADVDLEVARLVREEVGLPFDLERGPLLRLRVLRLGDGEHLVLFTVHHIAADGWSLAVFAREVAALYPAFLRGDASPLPELPLQYADFAAWQRDWLAGEALEVDLAWWRQRLQGAPELLELPADRPRQAAPSGRGGSRAFVLPDALTAELGAVARRQGSTLFMVLLAAFQAWLHRLTGEEDLCIGSPVAGRTQIETEALIGVFVNTLVLRGNPTGALPWRELLARARETVLAAHAHQDLPFERLVEELRPERALSRSPLFQVLLVLQNTPGGPVSIPGLDLQVLALPAGGAKLDLSLTWREAPEGLSGQIEYAADLFDDVTVGRWQEQLAALLSGLGGHLDAPVSALPLLGVAERHQLLVEWNDTGAVDDRDGLCLHALVVAQAERTPDAIAVVSESGDLTYGELLERSGRQAARLAAAGIGPGSFVPLVLGSSRELVLGMLAVMRAGAAFVPLDPEWPEARRREILDELAGLSGGLAGAPAAGPEAPIYAIYTSGSTGRPKGVVVPHRGIVNRFLWMDRRFGAVAECVLQTTRPIYDSAVWQIFWPLTRGGKTVLTPSRWGLDPDALVGAIERHRVTMADFVPSVFNLIVDRVARGDEPRERLASLRAVVVGGEEMDLGAARTFKRLYPQVLAVNLYGPTEASIGCICHPVGEERRERVPIGRPIDNVAALVLDAAGSPVPVGAAGELFLAGRCVGIGYLEDPEKTGRAFLPNPLAPTGAGGQGQERMYRTGDRVRWLPEGSLEFLGRLDRQVKIRGLRIELGEIEAALASLPGVREAAVVARDLRLVAYIAGDATAEELRRSLRERLPDSMIPAAFVALAALPRTPGGKVDRKALPAPEQHGSEESYLAPRTPVEEVLAGLWADLLGLARVGATDHFFELGGHSLLATQVMSRLRSTFGVEMPLRDLFEAPRLADLAARVETARRAGAVPPAPSLTQVPREEPLPLSFAQQRLWFLDQLEPGSAAYNIPIALRLSGVLDPEALSASLSEVARRHESLRTSFDVLQGEPVQRVSPPCRVPLPWVDLGGLPEVRREGEARRLVALEVRRPFDLARGPLVRAALLRLGPSEHLALLTLHHIISDGWSLGVLIREVGALYRAFREGRPSSLAPLPVQYGDFAVWQRGWLVGEALESRLAFWRRRLADAPPPLELPTDRPRPPVAGGRCGARRMRLPETVFSGLAALGRRFGMTLFMTFLAALEMLLQRYTGGHDLLIGTPVAGRTREEIEGLIGFFVNTLVLRADLSGAPSYRELAGRVREEVLAAYAHQDLPFERLVEEVAPERSLSRTPLIQVMLAFQYFTPESLELPELSLEPVEAPPAEAKLDLLFRLAESESGLSCLLEFRRDLFDTSTADRMLNHFESLLCGIAADPGQSLAELPLLSEAESAQILREWNDTEVRLPDLCLHELFAAQAARTPAAAAVMLDDQVLTYGDLARHAAALATHLRALGITPELPVGICMERSLEMVAALLGVLAAGGACLPLDPEYPRDRLAFLLADADPALVLTRRHPAPGLPIEGRRLLSVNCGEETPQDRADAPSPPAPAAPGNLACILYTSGSTGRPKGVMATHEGLVNRLLWAQRQYPLAAGDRVLQSASFSFDFALWEILGPLASGACVVLARPGGQRDSAYLADLIARRRITVAHFIPSMLELFLEERLEECGDLRLVFSGGEPLTAELRDRFFKRLGAELHNQYGPTEASIDVSHWLCSPEEGSGRVPLGRPVDNTRIYLLDRSGRPVPAGVAGELYIGGVALARGYLNRPDLTAERFVPDPWSGIAATACGERLYCTGDLARSRSDGSIEHLGRADQQVKIRGFRIEPEEIEAVLAAQPAVKQAAVAVRGEGPGRRLVAYVVPEAGAERPDPGVLRRALAERLPDYMVPAAFVLLESLPLTASGKLDRRALPEPEAPAPADRGAAAYTQEEEILAGLWADVLGLGRVGLDDDFFTLGGHSLLATRLISRVRKVFGVEVPLRSLFEAPTVAGFAPVVEAARRSGAPAAVPPIVPVPRDAGTAPLPLSFAQQRLWFLAQLEPESAAYNVPTAVRLTGVLDLPALAAALGGVVIRHETLRTTFPAVAGEPVQEIAPAGGPLELPLVDLGALPEPEVEARRLAAAEALCPFDLVRGPLLRGALLRLAAGEHIALLSMHHIVSDAWSKGVLLRELAALYAASREGRPSPLPPLPVQSADFAVWQRSWMEGEALESLLAFWRQRLAGAPAVLELPADRPRPAVPTGRGGMRTTRISGGLAELGRRQGLTLFMILLAAWDALLFRLTGQADLVVGAPIANRTRTEIEGLIGFFTNTLALRARISPEASFRELALRVREEALLAFSHQDLPFERLVEELSPERSLAYTPLFQVMFTLVNVPLGDLALPGLTLSPLELGGRTAKVDLTLFLAEADGGLLARLEYASDLFDATTADRILERFRTLLEGATADPELRLAELPLLPTAERQQILLEWNDVPAWDGSPCVHRRIEAQARRTPEATAVLRADGTGLSYGELDRLADRLARRLLALGVRPDDRVGVCLERSWEGVAALLAVLKAGGCYLPLDPGYPQERLGFMLADAAARVIVTRDRLAAALPPHGARVLSLDGGWPEEGNGGDLPAVGPEHLGYVIYTSGSTGRPKGVALPHRTLANLIAWQTAASAAPAGRTLQFASPSFDVSLQEVTATWAAGGTLVLVPDEIRSDAVALLRHLVKTRVERLFLPFVALQQLAEAAAGSPPELALREIVTAGEQLQITPEVRALFSRLPGCVLRNQYGPSETHVVTEASLLPGAVEEWPALPPIGRPIAATAVHLLDPRGLPVPVGVPGEACLGGAGLARGYLGRPDLTAERFVPDPWGRGARLYRTGDLARRRPTGEIEFLGRIDHQVKVRGFRVELGEIEAALAAHPAVREAVVVAQGDGAGRRLAAFIVPAGGERGLREPLRAHLRDRLPEYMVPAVFVEVDGFPLTPSGKVDRRALAAGGPAPGEATAAGEAPRNPFEELLAGIWTEVLGLERVGAADHFFDLGGHSLLATRVMSRLRAAFDIEMPLRELFQAPVLADLAARVEEALRASAGRLAPPLLPAAPAVRERPLPLSFAQQRLWFIDQLEPGSPLYNIPVALRAEGPLDAGVLARSLGEIVRRHEALRTVFATLEGTPAQVIQPATPFVLPVVDLSALPQSRRETVALLLAGDEAALPFDLARGPLMRCLLLRLTQEDHVAALTLHHIVSDGWSMTIMVREVTTFYAALAAGRPSPLPELPVQYADFSVWQRSWLHGEILEDEISFWRRQLAGLPPLLNLPTDRPRPAVQSYRGASRPVRLPAGLTRPLQALGRREGATLFMVLLAAFQALLARTSGQDDLAVGSPVAGRNRLEIEGLIGFFVNTLVLRADLKSPSAFRDLLGQVRETALAAHTHQDVPFEKLVQELSPERSLAHSPLFQVMLVLQNTPAETLEVQGLRLRPAGGARTTAKLDLTLSLEEQKGELRGTVEYSTDLFDATTIDRLIGCFERLLAGAVAAPERSVRALPLLSPAESGQILIEWNDTAPVPAPAACLHELLEAQVRRAPEAVALVAEGREILYRELDQAAGRLADELRRRGAGPEVVVGVCLERSAEMVAALLAILKAGAAYLPLDPRLPRERLEALLSGARVSMVVGEAKLAAGLPWSGPVVLLPLSRPAEGDGTEHRGSEGLTPDPENLAYVLFTSGSTGAPKGVAVTHRSAVELVRWAGTVYAPEELAGVLASTSLSFDLSVFELFVPLAWGGTVILARDVLELPALLSSGPSAGRVTLVNTVPSAMAELVDAGSLGASVRTVNLAGEPLPRTLADRLYATGTVEHVWNLYGPSEDTTYSTFARVPREGSAAPGIGRPIAATQAYVLAAGPEPLPVPVGVTGELYLGGAGLARGYLHRPDLTAERFVPDPFGGGAGGRLYRTGDLVRRLGDGSLEFLGRLDHQVKVRGFRIELGEVESVLASLPGVREAVAVVREDRLIAYVAGDATADALRQALRERLPDYMVPAAFVTLAALPLTPNGKVDRKALPAPEWQSAAESPLEPRTPVEELVAGIWAEVLRVDRPGVHDDFFALGGHSLLAAQVVSRVRTALGVELPLRALFEAPTIAGLSRMVDETRRESRGVSMPPLKRVRREEGAALPLSYAQQRLWFLHQIDPWSPTYHLQSAVELCGPLDVAALGAALNEVVRRHEALRTGFAEIDGEPVQVVAPAHRVPLPLFDMTDIAGHDPRAMVRALTAQQVVLPFDLAQPPLLRACLVRFGSDHHAILLTVHHIASDGWSLRLMVREMAILYQAFLAGRPSPLPELPVQYADFAVWQRSWLSGEAMETLSRYWKSRLAGAPLLLELPFDRKRPPLPDNRGAGRPYTIPQDLSDSLKRVASAQRATLFMTLLAAFKTLLYSYSGQEDMVVGTNVAGRASAEVEGLIGFFINMLALRTDLSGNPTFTELLQRVRESTLEAYSHQEMPFVKVVDELRLERSLSHTPVFQAVLTLQPAMATDEVIETPELTLSSIGLDVAATPFDLVFNLSETAAGISGLVIYNAQLFEAATITRLMERYTALLCIVGATPERRLAEIREALFEGLQEREFGVAARRAFKSARRQAVAVASKVPG